MPETDSSTSTQADDVPQSQADKTQQSQADTTTDKSQADESISLDEAKKLRKEAQSLRKRLLDMETAQQKAKDAELSEVERLKKQVTDYEGKESAWATEKRERDARDSILGVLSDESAENKYRARNARAVYKYIKDDLEYSDDGKVLNLSDLLKKAKAEAPELFQGKVSASAEGGLGSGNGGTIDMNQRIRQAAGHTVR